MGFNCGFVCALVCGFAAGFAELQKSIDNLGAGSVFGRDLHHTHYKCCDYHFQGLLHVRHNENFRRMGLPTTRRCLPTLHFETRMDGLRSAVRLLLENFHNLIGLQGLRGDIDIAYYQRIQTGVADMNSDTRSVEAMDLGLGGNSSRNEDNPKEISC